MPINVEEVMNLCGTLATEQGLKVTVSESLKGGLISGIGATIGGLLGGPLGIAAGATVGGTVAAITCYQFQPVAQVLRDMPSEKKRILYDQVMAIVQTLDYSDALVLLTLVQADFKVLDAVLGAIKSHVTGQLKMKIQD